MKNLLIVAHGSRRASSNDEVREITTRVGTKVNNQFDQVNCAFLELEKPSIPEGLKQCITNGATDIVVMPYFLSAGRHVVEDIPNEIKSVQALFPDITIRLAPYLGSAQEIDELILTLASTQTNK